MALAVPAVAPVANQNWKFYVAVVVVIPAKVFGVNVIARVHVAFVAVPVLYVADIVVVVAAAIVAE